MLPAKMKNEQTLVRAQKHREQIPQFAVTIELKATRVFQTNLCCNLYHEINTWINQICI